MSAQEEGSERRSFAELLRQVWLTALGSVSNAESELHKATTRLTERLSGNKEVALVAELVARAKKNRQALEQHIDGAVRAATQKWRAPIERELEGLRARLDAVEKKINRNSKS